MELFRGNAKCLRNRSEQFFNTMKNRRRASCYQKITQMLTRTGVLHAVPVQRNVQGMPPKYGEAVMLPLMKISVWDAVNAPEYVRQAVSV